MSLSSYIRDLAEVRIIDEAAGHYVSLELLRFHPDWVGITVQTPCAERAYEIADFSRNDLKIKTVLGGTHASFRPDEAIQHADHVVVGEGEIVFRELVLGTINQPVIQGISLPELDSIPPFNWEETNLKFYVQKDTPFPPLKNPRSIGMITSRGCPGKCIFCHNSLRTTKTRFNSAERVCHEIDYLMENHYIDSIAFVDDEFLMNKRRLSEMCQHFREVGLVWGCQARSTMITDEKADLLSKSGCSWVGIGFESGNQRTLNILKANLASVEGNIEAIKILKNHGIMVIGSFIFGTPSETYNEMMDTIDFIIEQPFDLPNVNSLTPYPASSLWHMVEDKLGDVNYSELVPSSNPSVILCDTMLESDYKRVLNFASCVAKFKRGIRLSRILNQSRLNLFTSDPFYPYFVLRHPLTTMKIIRRAW